MKYNGKKGRHKAKIRRKIIEELEAATFTQKEIAVRNKVAPATVTAITKELIKDNIDKKHRDPNLCSAYMKL